MRRQITVALAATAFLFVGAAGSMAQTGSMSQSAPVGKDVNPAMQPNHPTGVVVKKKKKAAVHRVRPASTTGSMSQSAPVGKDMNPAMRSR